MKKTERIQKYLDGEMNESELKKFREDLKKFPDLAQELDLHRNLNEALISQDEKRFRKKLSQVYKDYLIITGSYKPINSSGGKVKRLGIVSVFVTILIGIFLAINFQWFGKQSNETIFNKYLVSYNKDLSSRVSSSRENTDKDLELAVKLYVQNNYSGSSGLLKKILSKNPENIDAQFYNGLCSIYLNDFESAITYFENVSQSTYNYYGEYASWYLALCYIRINDNQTAKVILKEIEAGNGFFSSKAKKILSKLK